MADREPITRWELIPVALMTLVGLAVRLWFAARAPGLWYDEAIYGLDALDVARKPGYWPIFFDTENHMREPLYMYLLAIPLKLFGPSAWVIRASSAFIGAAAIPVVWLLAREWRGPLFALGAALLFASSRWHIHFSGLAFRTITSPLACAAAMLFLLRMLRTASMRDAAAFGVALGVCAYTYLACRLMPAIVAVPMFAEMLRRRGTPGFAPFVRASAASAGIAAAVFAPLGIHFLRHPDHFSGREDEVSYLSKPGAGALLWKQTRDVFLMPMIRGDHEGKHNTPGLPQFAQLQRAKPDRVLEAWTLEEDAARSEGRPAYDPHGTGVPLYSPLMGPIFYVGLLALLLGALRSSADAAMAAWLAVGSLASILSFGAPNMLRLLFLSPAATLVLAAGFAAASTAVTRIAGGIGDRMSPPRGMGWLSMMLHVWLAAGTALPQAVDDASLLRRWGTHPMVVTRFNTELADIGAYLSAQPDRLPLRMPEPIGAQATLRFTADGTAINPPRERLGDAWWEFRTVAPFPPLEPLGTPKPGGRRHRIMHPAGIEMGELVEVQRP